MTTLRAGADGEASADYAETVARLIPIWSETLRATGVTPDSNFFDLGGDSLLALALFLAVESATGHRFPITAIYDAPTIAEMAELIVAGRTPGFSPLVCVKPGVSGTPLFLVHGIGGTVVELSALARHVPDAVPVYAIQARGIDGTEEPLYSVEDMAEFYLDWITKRQPTGPYMLCGYSFGGLVAVEIARRLQRLGQGTSLLILMDAFAHPKTWPFRSRARVFLRRSLVRSIQAVRQPRQRGMPMLRVAAGRVRQQLSGSANGSQLRRRQWQLEMNPDMPPSLLKVREAASEALAAYVPRFFAGKVTFLKAARRDLDFPLDPAPIWRHLVRELDVHTVPGGHHTIVRDDAAEVGAALGALIAQTLPPEGDRGKGVAPIANEPRPARFPQAIGA